MLHADIESEVERFQRRPFFPDEGPMLETLDFTIRIGSTPTFLYFDLYLYSAYAVHYVYKLKISFQPLHNNNWSALLSLLLGAWQRI